MVSAGLDKGAVRVNGTRGTPNVGGNHERTISVGGNIVQDRMSCAIYSDGFVIIPVENIIKNIFL